MKYDAFISYRHLERDMFVAKGVHKALETAKIPKRIQKETGRKKINRVFRDQEELPIGSDLGNNIDLALRESEFLIVICSPKTKESYWVMKEIDTFISLHGRQNVLAVLVEGEPDESFPLQLCVDENGKPVEPLAADVRGTTKKEVKRKIKSETLRLAASIIHCDYDDLKQRHKERIMRRNMSIAAAVAVLGVSFGVYNAYNLKRINENYQQKLINESKVLAATSLDVLEKGDRETAAIIAMEGLPVNGIERPFVSDSMYALEQALGSYSKGEDFVHDMLLSHDLPVKSIEMSSDGSRLLSYDNGETIYWWDVNSGELLFKKNADYYERSVEEVVALQECDGNLVAVTSHYLTAYSMDGNKVFDKFFENNIYNAQFDSANEYVAVSTGSKIEIYETKGGTLSYTYEEAEDDVGTSKMCFSDNSDYLAIQHYDLFGDNCSIEFVNLKNGESHSIAIQKDSVLDMFYSPDGYFLMASADQDDILGVKDYFVNVRKIDYKTGEVIWSQKVESPYAGMQSGYTRIRAREYEGAQGKCSEVFVSTGKRLYNLDLYTGEISTTVSFPDEIYRYLIALSSKYVFVGTFDGKLWQVDGTAGRINEDQTIDVADSLLDLRLNSAHVVARSYRSNEVTVMSLISDESVKEIAEPEQRVYSMIASPDETTYCVIGWDYEQDGYTIIDVYGTDNDELINECKLEDITMPNAFYLDDDTIVFTDTFKGIYFYDVRTNTVENVKALDIDYSVDYALSDDKKHILAYDMKDLAIVDLSEKKVIKQLNIDDVIYFAAVTNDCSKAFAYNSNKRCVEIDLNTGEMTDILIDYLAQNIVISPDDSCVAVACTDGVLRVMDSKSKKILDELPYFGKDDNLLQFSPDGDKLFLQGDDLYFKIYDLTKKEFVMITDGQLNDIKSGYYDEKNNCYAFRNGYDMYVVDLASNGFIHSLEYGRIYLPGKQEIICGYNNDVYSYKVKTLDDLVEGFKEKYGDATLTNEQRLKYKIN
ncbi:toll/interleukin-1 receptor domain-containing protein [Butyrivibrio sp. YAB3001]|uniref:toll/interleukin-1 receptor domain-containing protein n=1 Tax=Butyrivibrio sp. YAB3001 TaxID=1520812 RepID=UPI0008F65434|nr:toll/interleukin-1 receptor domain-containing protein [Butyrivibrio sp. YAB3001]SFC19592.1 WD40 repeat [Butyrivibrio sp. YAB3001]